MWSPANVLAECSPSRKSLLFISSFPTPQLNSCLAPGSLTQSFATFTLLAFPFLSYQPLGWRQEHPFSCPLFSGFQLAPLHLIAFITTAYLALTLKLLKVIPHWLTMASPFRHIFKLKISAKFKKFLLSILISKLQKWMFGAGRQVLIPPPFNNILCIYFIS